MDSASLMKRSTTEERLLENNKVQDVARKHGVTPAQARRVPLLLRPDDIPSSLF